MLTGEMNMEYSGKIYLEYENKIDSAVVHDRHFSFNGILDRKSILAQLGNGRDPSALLFLQPGKLNAFINIKGIQQKNHSVSYKWFVSAMTGSVDFERWKSMLAANGNVEKMFPLVTAFLDESPQSPLAPMAFSMLLDHWARRQKEITRSL